MSGRRGTVARGCVLVYRGQDGTLKVSAVSTRAECEGMKKRVTGSIVSAVGLEFRYAQGTLRVLTDPAQAIARMGDA